VGRYISCNKKFYLFLNKKKTPLSVGLFTNAIYFFLGMEFAKGTRLFNYVPIVLVKFTV